MTAYVIYQGEVLDPERYDEYKTKAAASILAAGGKYVVRNGKSVSLYGEPPKALAIMQFESLATAQAVFGSKAYTDAKAIGDKYAKFRIYAVEGLQ